MDTLKDVLHTETVNYLDALRDRQVPYTGVRYASAVAMEFEPTAEHLRDFYRALVDAPRELLAQGTPWPTLSDCHSPECCVDGEWLPSDYGNGRYVYVGSVWQPNGDLRWYAYVIGYTNDTFREAYLVEVVRIAPPYLT